MASAIEYIAGNSKVHQLNPLTKLVWLVAVMLIALVFTDGYYLLAVLMSVLMVATVAGILPKLLPIIKGLSVFAFILMLLQLVFWRHGPVLFYLLPGQHLPIYSEAVILGVSMGLRMMAVVLSFLVFLATTQFKDIVLILTDKLKLPYDYVFMFMTALRFIPVFLTEITKVKEAQASRCCQVDGGNPMVKIKSYFPVALPLVIISLQKADKLAMAMETRGYGSGQRTYFKQQSILPQDVMLMVTCVLLALAAIIVRVNGYGG
ncbi:energy-coupling factor transporter transmembrane component T [Peptococcaceae bacterium 1198_IL3148]